MTRTAVRAALVIAATYGYFLIFAQFSFVELLRAGGTGLLLETVTLGIMAVAGMASGFIAAARGVTPRMLRCALGVAAVAAATAPVANSVPACYGIAVVTGGALGVATVALAAMLPSWCGLFWVGIGTGLGYACCNVPAVFQQSPSVQAWIAAGFALSGLLAVPSEAAWPTAEPRRVFPLGAALAVFAALVWLDSAAFFIIQHLPGLKAATWGDGMLWRNAALHFMTAAMAGVWLARGGARVLPVIAFGLLGAAALAVNTPASRGLAGWLYPAGVSLYSTALVAWPGWFGGADGPRPAAWKAAWLFAIAGWLGSANGIAMAQALNQVPLLFVVAVGAVVVATVFLSEKNWRRPALAVGLVGCVAALVHGGISTPPTTAVERGRRVYLAEGCIHCHSQYPRPDSPDETIWGPAPDPREVLRGQPVLIGNRRQGPDLANIGARRSAAWLKLHFLDPQSLSPGTAMPSYAHLFNDARGDDLVEYLKQSGANSIGSLMAQSAQWKPGGTATINDGQKLFTTHCAACHGTTGEGNGPLARNFTRPPANLANGPFTWTNAGEATDLRVARVIKFGIPGHDMPGHETLTDPEVLTLTKKVLELRP